MENQEIHMKFFWNVEVVVGSPFNPKGPFSHTGREIKKGSYNVR